MFDDVVKTIKAQLYDRVTSPLFGTFLMSWLAWNWRLPVLFLFDSTTNVLAKFAYVDAALYSNPSKYYLEGFLYPLVTTGFFIGIYPWLARPVYGYWRHQINRQKELQQEIDNETPLLAEEARKLRRDVLEAELKYQTESEQREARIKDLEGIIKSLQQESDSSESIQPYKSIPKLSQETTERTEETSTGMLLTLKEVANYEKGVSRDDLVSNLPVMNRVRKEHYLDLLVEDKFLRSSMNALYMTPKGRAAILKNSLDEQ